MVWWLLFLSHWLFMYWNWHRIESLFTAFGWKEIREEYWKGKGTVLFCLFDWRESADKKRREKRDKGLKGNTILRDVSTFHPICVEREGKI